MHHPKDRITHTTAFVTPVVEHWPQREIAQWVHPTKDRSDDPSHPVVHNWFIKGRGMYCSVYGKVHIKDPLLLIEKSSLCGGSGFPSKKCVNVTI